MFRLSRNATADSSQPDLNPLPFLLCPPASLLRSIPGLLPDSPFHFHSVPSHSSSTRASTVGGFGTIGLWFRIARWPHSCLISEHRTFQWCLRSKSRFGLSDSCRRQGSSVCAPRSSDHPQNRVLQQFTTIPLEDV